MHYVDAEKVKQRCPFLSDSVQISCGAAGLNHA